MEQNLTAAAAAVITILDSGRSRHAVQGISLQAGWGIALTIQGEHGASDLLAFAPDGNWIQAAGLRGHGEFFWVRTKAGVVEDAFSVRATHFDYDGINLHEEELCAPSAAF
jgi:hypothetical protein